MKAGSLCRWNIPQPQEGEVHTIDVWGGAEQMEGGGKGGRGAEMKERKKKRREG